MLLEYFDTYARDHRAYKRGEWCYEDGLIYRGLELLHRATGEDRWLDHLTRLLHTQLSEGPELHGYRPNEYNIDNILPGRALMYMHDVTGKNLYIDAAALLADQLRTHPRTKTGIYWHKLRYPWQVWLDGLYMGPPFQIAYGLRTGKQELVEDSLTQFGHALDMTYAPQTKLYSHAVDEVAKQPWANPVTGHSKAHWARSLGWLAMAMVDVRELVGEERFAPLAARTKDLLSRIADMRQSNGLWLQVIDQPDLKGNYEETSASAMFVYALCKAQNLGLWSGNSKVMVETLLAQAIKPKQGGGQEMVQMCHVAGLGMYENRFRDGSADYYVSETITTDDPKGVGPMMALGALCFTGDLQDAAVPAAE